MRHKVKIYIKGFSLPRIAELIIPKEKSIDSPLVDANKQIGILYVYNTARQKINKNL